MALEVEMATDITAALRGFILEELLDELDTIEDDDSLLADDMIDSLGMVRLVAFIEDSFQITVPPEDFVISNFATLAAISDYLRTRASTTATPDNGS